MPDTASADREDWLHMYIGEEAIAVGVCEALEDLTIPNATMIVETAKALCGKA